MNSILHAVQALANFARHRYYRRRVVERALRRFTSKKQALRYARFIP
jgi:hypothetical protein